MARRAPWCDAASGSPRVETAAATARMVQMIRPALTLHVVRYHSGMRQAPHAHDELHCSIVLRGTVSETVAGRTEMLGPLSLVSKDPGIVHANAWGNEGALLARLSIANHGLADLTGDPRRGLPWRWSHEPRVAAAFLHLVRRAREAESRVELHDPDVADLLAALLRQAGKESPGGSPPAWLRGAVALIREGGHPDLGVRDVAACVGVHPVYLARSLRRWYGVTAGDELRRMRLRTAVRSLVGSAERVSHVAHGTGFADEPHLCRSLRAATSFTPGQLRRLVRHADAIARPVSGG